MATIATPSVPVSWGELLDESTTLEFKRERITRPEALAYVTRKYRLLRAIGAEVLGRSDMSELVAALKREINLALESDLVEEKSYASCVAA